jgi:DNA mismatch repair protein MutL
MALSKGQPLIERVAAVMGGEVAGRMIEVDAGFSSALRLRGFISEPTLRRASAVDQYLFVNGRPVKDKVLVGALRAAYMDVMHAREFPLCALYLELPQREVDVNVSPAKTEVHFLEPARIRGFIIKTLRDALARTMLAQSQGEKKEAKGLDFPNRFDTDFWAVRDRAGQSLRLKSNACEMDIDEGEDGSGSFLAFENSFPLGKVVGQIGNKYILAELPNALAVVDQHAAAERITYERLRKHELKRQPLLFPIVAQLKPEQVDAILEISEELHDCGITAERFGEDAVSIQEKPADWELDWDALLQAVADEVFAHGHSAQFQEKLHLKLANHACHHSVRAGQRLSMESMDALLRDIEKTEHGGECNHGRPVYKIIPLTELDGWFER